ncbi:MAG: Tex-like N-terminal domain-containing protein [Alkalispirochaeta sp.]
MSSIVSRIAAATDIPERSVAVVVRLFGEGATVPFVARYRKDQTQNLDEEQLRQISAEHDRLRELDQRREAILGGLRERNLLSEKLLRALSAATTRSELEDIYAPFRPRRRTRADTARAAGLGPAVEALRTEAQLSVDELLRTYAPTEISRDEALGGVVDIAAAELAALPEVRGELFALFKRQGAIQSRKARGVAEQAAATYRDYLDWKEPLRSVRSHRVLAVFRGEREGALSVSVRPPDEAALTILRGFRAEIDAAATPPRSSHGGGRDRDALGERILQDAWKRLLSPSLETRMKRELREWAEVQATTVFAANLKEVLLAAPFGARGVLAIDPGFRSGSKMVVLDATGQVLHHETITPLPPHIAVQEGARRISDLLQRYPVEAIAVGNGTGGREMEDFLRELSPSVPVIRVSEAGASVYSASPAARREMPDLAVEYRGAVSIGRRLQDPLAELVKVDPAAIGVGQYQHDIDEKLLRGALSETVESCVNAVGVEVNTAGVELLSQVAGLNANSAAAVVRYRSEHGLFNRRSQLRDVAGIGEKSWTQAAGFLRCHVSADRRDHTGLHPEQYPVVEELGRSLGIVPSDLIDRPDLTSTVTAEDVAEMARRCGQGDLVGSAGAAVILAELRRGGADTREAFSAPVFQDEIRSIEDLTPDMVLEGTVTNITAFGAFVDIGVHRDGLVHVSRMAERFVSDPHEIVRVGGAVEVRVVEIDRERGRISLAMTPKASE